MKKLLTVVAITLAIPLFSLPLLGYFGERVFSRSGELPDVAKVIKNARSLIGAPYDPFMGKYNNIGAKLGFMVCTDVPNIAFGLSGYSLKKQLAEHFKINPNAYHTANGNNPSNPYFHRRARNLYAYFNSVGRLAPTGYQPSVGDPVFYRRSSKGWINHVALVTSVSDESYQVVESAPKTVFVQEVDGRSPLKRGWILAGFGRLY